MSLAMTTTTPEVAAYWPSGQRVAAELTLTNTGTRPESISLDALTSHYAWSVLLGQATLDLPAGGSQPCPSASSRRPTPGRRCRCG